MFKSAQNLKARPALYAVAIIVIVATGAYAGADIKKTTETQKVAQKFREGTTEERIVELEKSKEPLFGRKKMLEEKIEALRARQDGVKKKGLVFARGEGGQRESGKEG